MLQNALFTQSGQGRAIICRSLTEFGPTDFHQQGGITQIERGRSTGRIEVGQQSPLLFGCSLQAIKRFIEAALIEKGGGQAEAHFGLGRKAAAQLLFDDDPAVLDQAAYVGEYLPAAHDLLQLLDHHGLRFRKRR